MPKVATAHCNPKKQPALNHNDRTNDNAKTITKELTHLNESLALVMKCVRI
ncbi:hypothetical protein [Campylobacter coli]|uniref:hypothetical protein n=1 Tax=Campylobacter coli TaxID=195 RepID=UPI001CB798A5|nr:hypothetical protein [Campylobacter coli]